MIFIYHFKQARPLFNDLFIHATNIYHAVQEQREKTNKSTFIKPADLFYTWLQGLCLFGRTDFVEEDFVSP